METAMNNEKELINTEIVPMQRLATELVVKTQEERTIAIVYCKNAEEFKRSLEVKHHFTANKEKAHAAWKAALDTENGIYKPIDMSIAMVKGKIRAYDTAEAIKAQQAAAKAEAERLEKERIEREKLEAKAKKAEAQGKTEKAEVLREQAETVTVAPVILPPTNGKKLIWKAEAVNIMQLCKSITDGLVPFTVLEVKQSALNDFAKSHDGKTTIPGLRFWQETTRV